MSLPPLVWKGNVVYASLAAVNGGSFSSPPPLRLMRDVGHSLGSLALWRRQRATLAFSRQLCWRHLTTPHSNPLTRRFR